MRKSGKKNAVFIIVFAAVIGVISLTAAFGLFAFTRSSDYIDLDLNKIAFSKTLITVLDKNGNLMRANSYVNLDELSPETKSAFLAIEDNRFYSHNGVDYVGVARAVVKNLSSGKLVEGGSTITQQLVKNTHLTNDKTVKRKINEILLAYQLEEKLSKNQILESYLNTAYFGGDCVGLNRAASSYFGKNPKDLTLSEAALLAGMLKSPNYYSPDKNPENSIKRRNLVLDKMAERGYIDQTALTAAKSETIVKIKRPSDADFYLNSVYAEAAKILGISITELRGSNYIIHTYYNAETSDRLAESFKNQKTDFGFTPDSIGIIIDNNTRGVTAAYGNVKDLFSIKRQVGSLLKPLAVYAPALDTRQICVATPVLDAEISFGNYSPKNFGGKYQGWTTVTKALSESLNIPAIKTLNMIGVSTAKKYLTRNGITLTEKDDNLTLALGCVNEGVSPLEIASGYSTFANSGIYMPAGLIKSISLGDKLIYRHNGQSTYAFSRETAYLTTYMLMDAVKNGTAKALSDINFEVAAKTGTVGPDDNSDLYMCGYTTRETFFVWYGDEQARINKSLSAGKICGNVCREYLLSGKIPSDFSIPKGIAWTEYDKNELNSRHLLVEADYKTSEKIIVPIDITKNYYEN